MKFKIIKLIVFGISPHRNSISILLQQCLVVQQLIVARYAVYVYCVKEQKYCRYIAFYRDQEEECV